MNPRSHSAASRVEAELASLERSIAPAHDLWPDIEQVIGAPRGLAWPKALAAAAVLVAVTALMTTAAVRRLPVDDASRAVSYSPAPPASGDASRDASTRAREDLRRSFERRLPLLAPDTRETVLASLRSIQRAESELRQALARDPTSALLQDLTSAAARRELALYLDVVHATDSLTRRT